MSERPDLERAGRRDLYRLGSRLLAHEVDAALLARLWAADALTDAPLLDPGLSECHEHVVLEELAVEYCRLFVGPEPVCPPYASAHTGGRHLRGRAEQDLVTFLAAYGLEPVCRTEVSLLGLDHLSVHLAVLAHLHDRLTREPGNEPVRMALRHLVQLHTVPWAADLLALLAREARLAPYPTIGMALGQLLAQEVTDAA